MSAPLVLSIGQVGLDFFGLVPRFPDTDVPLELSEVSLQVGGSAAVAAATVAAMGCQPRLACKLADDFLGRYVLAALTQAGLETRCTLARGRQLSSFGFTAVSGGHGKRLAFFTQGDVEPLAADEIDKDSLLDGVAAILVDGSCPSAQRALAEIGRRREIPVVFDGSQLREGVGALVSLSDVVICSERLAAELAPRDDLDDCLAEIQRLGPRAVIITMGNAGSVGRCGPDLVRQPAFPVEVVDPSGAGSVYHGAFAAAMVSQVSFERCMEFASAAAALACRRLGGFAGIPGRDEVVATVRARRGETS